MNTPADSEEIPRGTRVRTAIYPDPNSNNWSAEATRGNCQWNTEGIVIFCHPRSGVYRVEHTDGVIAPYERTELIPE